MRSEGTAPLRWVFIVNDRLSHRLILVMRAFAPSLRLGLASRYAEFESTLEPIIPAERVRGAPESV